MLDHNKIATVGILYLFPSSLPLPPFHSPLSPSLHGPPYVRDYLVAVVFGAADLSPETLLYFSRQIPAVIDTPQSVGTVGKV